MNVPRDQALYGARPGAGMDAGSSRTSRDHSATDRDRNASCTDRFRAMIGSRRKPLLPSECAALPSAIADDESASASMTRPAIVRCYRAGATNAMQPAAGDRGNAREAGEPIARALPILFPCTHTARRSWRSDLPGGTRLLPGVPRQRSVVEPDAATGVAEAATSAIPPRPWGLARWWGNLRRKKFIARHDSSFTIA